MRLIIISYTGIPYAEPPLGDLRFAPPLLMTTMPSGVFDATNFGPSCIGELVCQRMTYQEISQVMLHSFN